MTKLLENKHIFLIEDDQVNLAIIKTILQVNGATVPFDHWGDTTLQRLISYPFDLDLILLDIMFPHGVTGYDIFEAIQADEKLKHVPVVAVTASDPDLEMPKARERGFLGYISKPVNRHKFAKQVQSILSGDKDWYNFAS